MTTMIAELYDALIAAGAPEDKARKAAETVAAYETRFTGLDGRLAKIDADMAAEFAKVHGEINLLKWMMGFMLAFQVVIFAKLFLH